MLAWILCFSFSEVIECCIRNALTHCNSIINSFKLFISSHPVNVSLSNHTSILSIYSYSCSSAKTLTLFCIWCIYRMYDWVPLRSEQPFGVLLMSGMIFRTLFYIWCPLSFTVTVPHILGLRLKRQLLSLAP